MRTPPLRILLSLTAALSVTSLTPGCGGDDDDDSPDVGMGDLGRDVGVVPTDLGPPDMGARDICNGPPGLYIADSCDILVPMVREYAPRFELWSDGSDKQRHVYLPERGVIDTSDPDGWVFPVGTAFFKTFSRDGRNLETRVMTKARAGEGAASWDFVAYRWNVAGDDVTLAPVEGSENILATSHDIPSQAECVTCHEGARDAVLGFGAIQLANTSLPLSLADLAAASEMSDPIEVDDAQIPGTPEQQAALGYLHANCAGCHGGPTPETDLDFQVPVGVGSVCETGTYRTALGTSPDGVLGSCATPGVDSTWGADNVLRVTEGVSALSAVYLRANSRLATDQMPPLGTEVVDTAGVEILRRWIDAEVSTGRCVGPPGLYAPDSCDEVAEGLQAFQPRYQLWSDASAKDRYVYLPPGAQINTADPNAWIFPTGTIFWKTFSRGGRRLETRIIHKTGTAIGAGSWEFSTYAWDINEAQVSEVGVGGALNVLGTTHDIPSQTQCLECHAGSNPDGVLGFGAIQLGGATLPLTLDDLVNDGWLSTSIAMGDAQVPGTPTQQAALGYLHGNCSGCHGGEFPMVGLDMQVRVGLATVCETATYETALGTQPGSDCSTPGVDSAWGTAGVLRVDAGDATNSAIYLRMNSRGDFNQMPPVGTEDIDSTGLGAIQTWINGGI